MADPALRDEVAAASYAYDEALMNYQGALGSNDPGRRATAETRLTAASARLSRAQTAVVAARLPQQPVTLTTMLNDPMQQLDPDGEVMRSILDYQQATSNTPSATPSETRGGTDE